MNHIEMSLLSKLDLIMKLFIHLKPNSRHREEIVVSDDGVLTVYTKAPAIEGQANTAAMKLLAKYFGVAPSKVKLVRGAGDRRVDRYRTASAPDC